jgi:hypothetical protein
MLPLGLAVAFVVGIIVASVLWKKYQDKELVDQPIPDGNYPFERQRTLMTEIEHGFFRVLQRELGNDTYVFPKVRLGDLLAVSRKTERRQFYQNLIRSKVVDFVLCDLQNVMPVLVIQLGDVGGDKDEAHSELVDEFIKSAGLPLLRLPLSQSVGPSELKMMVRRAIKYRGVENAAAV